jgi:glycosyltransferase involved in cell wall biosynthesis
MEVISLLKNEMKKILILHNGPFFMPNEIPVMDKYNQLSSKFCGDIIAVINNKEFANYQIGAFSLRGIYLPGFIRFRTLLRSSIYFLFVLYRSLRSSKERKYEIVVSPDALVTGLIGTVISRVLKIKMIVEVNGNYASAFRFNVGPKNWFTEIEKEKVIKKIVPFVINKSHGVRLLYEDQLKAFKNISTDKVVKVFHDFVPIQRFKPIESQSDDYILFLGFPWLLKGVDVLIRAFCNVSDDFPIMKLKIVGYCQNKAPFRELAGGNMKIEFCEPIWYESAIELIQRCSLFVLPSRTEAMGRVLLEAMACRKPIIASNVDGIPTYIKDGYNGLLFKSENVSDLEDKMKMILSNSELSKRLAINGFNEVHSKFSEAAYIENMDNLIEEVLSTK